MSPTRWLIWWVAGTLLTLAAGAVAIAWSGIYNVAASRGHWPVTEVFLRFVMQSSVRTHSLGLEAPPLDDPDLVRLGAAHFASGCALCHGAPGDPIDPLFERMLPLPPPLSEAALEWKPKALFWIVKHGLKYTGMPAWVAPGRGDEVWAVVAFLRRLPKLTAKEYRELAKLREDDPSSPAELVRSGKDAVTGTACARCHEGETSPPASRLIPKLAGQRARYLQLSLKHYADGTRPSGIMQQIAARLDEKAVQRLSVYYSHMAPIRQEVAAISASSEQVVRGRKLAEAGAPGDGIPPCLACHGSHANPIFPRLAGQHAPYVVGQLRLWKQGLRDLTVTGAIMAPIAKRLSEEQIEDVAAYFASAADAGQTPTAASRPVQP